MRTAFLQKWRIGKRKGRRTKKEEEVEKVKGYTERSLGASCNGTGSRRMERETGRLGRESWEAFRVFAAPTALR